jgi:hypothetical protein
MDKTIATAEYKKVYFIPALESKLAYCLNNRADWRNARNEKMTAALDLIRNEITKELDGIGTKHFPEVDRLAIGKFDSALAVKTTRFLVQLKKYYANLQNDAIREKEALQDSLNRSPEASEAFKADRERFTNKAVSDAVKNINSADRILEYDGRLVQKIYPIYRDDHDADSKFDFSANLYQPTKQFAGVSVDTLYFNLAVIWLMTALLYAALYFDVLRRLIQKLETHRKYRRK